MQSQESHQNGSSLVFFIKSFDWLFRFGLLYVSYLDPMLMLYFRTRKMETFKFSSTTTCSIFSVASFMPTLDPFFWTWLAYRARLSPRSSSSCLWKRSRNSSVTTARVSIERIFKRYVFSLFQWSNLIIVCPSWNSIDQVLPTRRFRQSTLWSYWKTICWKHR